MQTSKDPPQRSAPLLERPTPLDGVHPVRDWAWAQERTNFAIVAPKPGSPWTLSEPTVRGESATDYSSVRFDVADGSGRRLRAKQYFNDWWIPTVADVSLRAAGTPVVHAHGVGFIGRDYKRSVGGCGHRLGTAIEFSVEDGQLSDEEWTGLWSSLDAVVPETPVAVRRSSYARRNYWNRWHRTKAPWDTTELSSLRWTDPTGEAMEKAAWALTADRWAPVPGTIDSIGFRKDGPQGEEVQMVFRWPMSLDTSAWLRVVRNAPSSWRPLIDASEVNRPKWTRDYVAGVSVERACMDPRVGNWFFAWRAGTSTHELHLRAQKGLDAAAAERVLRGLLS